MSNSRLIKSQRHHKPINYCIIDGLSVEQVYDDLAEIFIKILSIDKDYSVKDVLAKFRKETNSSLESFVACRGVQFREVIEILRNVKNLLVHFNFKRHYMVSRIEIDNESEEIKERNRRGVYAGCRDDLYQRGCNIPDRFEILLNPMVFNERFILQYSSKATIQSLPVSKKFEDYFCYELSLVMKNIKFLGLEKLTPIQERGIPLFHKLASFGADFDVFIRSPAKRGVNLMICLGSIFHAVNSSGRTSILIITNTQETAKDIYDLYKSLTNNTPFTPYLSKGTDERLIIKEIYISDIKNFKRDLDVGVVTTQNVLLYVFKDINELDSDYEDILTIDSADEDHIRVFCTKNNSANEKQLAATFFRDHEKFVTIMPDEFS